MLAIIAASAVVVLLFLAGMWLEKSAEQPENRGNPNQRYEYDSLMTIDGVSYRPKDVTTILIMGIDRDSSASVIGYRNGGQADFLQLLVLDHEAKKISRLQIDRDTMTPITVLGVLGNKAGVRTAQVCLSHGFGDGKAQSCEFTADAVSNLLSGIQIDFYAAVSLDGISTINDLAGGVTVTLEDDFSSLDATMTKGKTLTLMGNQAEYYVRHRMSIGVGTNEARMRRQEQYISALSEKLISRFGHDKEYIGEVYDRLTPYLMTNMSRGRLINEIWAVREYMVNPLIKPSGVHEIGSDGFMQFHVDQEDLQKIVMDLMYEVLK